MSVFLKSYYFTSIGYFISKVNSVYGFLGSFDSPEFIFAEKNTCFLFCHHFSKTGNMSIFSKIALFHINCYFIGKVSPMYGFLAGLSSPELIIVIISKTIKKISSKSKRHMKFEYKVYVLSYVK